MTWNSKKIEGSLRREHSTTPKPRSNKARRPRTPNRERTRARHRTGTRIPEAVDRLIELYTATNKPDEVKKWQAEREKYRAKGPSSKGEKK